MTHFPPPKLATPLSRRDETTSWEEELGSSLRTAADLAQAGLVSTAEAARLDEVLRRYKFLLTPYYASLIDPKDPNCPIRRQAIPSLEELDSHAGLHADPLSDLRHQPAKRVTHRYRKRLLIHLTSNCSMYCRFCFRKSLLNELATDLFRGDIAQAIAYVREHSEVEEVIFSGGDPLMVADRQLDQLLLELGEIPHLERLRFHSRVPVTLPMRITRELAALLGGSKLPVVVVTHFNHPRELTAPAAEGLHRLRTAGVMLLNQSVLLRKVNDAAPVLAELCRSLFPLGVLPYYLHHPDRSEGTGHFDISMEEGLAIYDTLRADLPGYLVPRYVIDVVGHPYKMSVEEYVRGSRSS